jgi:hypothetical protein
MNGLHKKLISVPKKNSKAQKELKTIASVADCLCSIHKDENERNPNSDISLVCMRRLCSNNIFGCQLCIDANRTQEKSDFFKDHGTHDLWSLQKLMNKVETLFTRPSLNHLQDRDNMSQQLRAEESMKIQKFNSTLDQLGVTIKLEIDTAIVLAKAYFNSVVNTVETDFLLTSTLLNIFRNPTNEIKAKPVYFSKLKDIYHRHALSDAMEAMEADFSKIKMKAKSMQKQYETLVGTLSTKSHLLAKTKNDSENQISPIYDSNKSIKKTIKTNEQTALKPKEDLINHNKKTKLEQIRAPTCHEEPELRKLMKTLAYEVKESEDPLINMLLPERLSMPKVLSIGGVVEAPAGLDKKYTVIDQMTTRPNSKSIHLLGSPDSIDMLMEDANAMIHDVTTIWSIDNKTTTFLENMWYIGKQETTENLHYIMTTHADSISFLCELDIATKNVKPIYQMEVKIECLIPLSNQFFVTASDKGLIELWGLKNKQVSAAFKIRHFEKTSPIVNLHLIKQATDQYTVVASNAVNDFIIYQFNFSEFRGKPEYSECKVISAFPLFNFPHTISSICSSSHYHNAFFFTLNGKICKCQYDQKWRVLDYPYEKVHDLKIIDGKQGIILVASFDNGEVQFIKPGKTGTEIVNTQTVNMNWGSIGAKIVLGKVNDMFEIVFLAEDPNSLNSKIVKMKISPNSI